MLYFIFKPLRKYLSLIRYNTNNNFNNINSYEKIDFRFKSLFKKIKLNFKIVS